jgi:predicted membrane-bound dolichyl-phosphate-mannose-protein mannosyltransferase
MPTPKRTRWAKKHRIPTIAALVIVLAFALFNFSVATGIQGTAGYASDETWYVISARNMFRDVFGAQPTYIDSIGRHHYTVFFSSRTALREDNADFRDFVENELDGSVTMGYSKAHAISIAVFESLENTVITAVFPSVKLVQSGFNYPDVSGAETYLNMEHPPLVKYILGLSMLALGDQPIAWRAPGIILGALALLVTYFIVARLLKNDFFALLVFPLALADPVLRAMSSVAMLDIYVVFFVALSMWFALRRSYLLSAVFIGLGTSCKLTGAFPLFALFFLMLYFRKSSFKKMIFYPFVVSFFVWALVNSPMMLHFGFFSWISEVQNGLQWFVTSRPPGPVVSTPWGWFVNENPFMINANPDVFASVNIAVYLLALAALVTTPYLIRKLRNRNIILPSLWFLSTFVGYVAVYILGNRTMYSFYVVTFAPMAYALVCVIVFWLSRYFEKRFKSCI